MRNIEIKVAIIDKQTMMNRIEMLGAEYQHTMKQSDYYFEIGEGKEKLRVIDDCKYELITYQRKEKSGRKDSFYDVKTLSSTEKDTLLLQRKTIKYLEKIRELWLYGNTRIHIDNVKDLGDFLELETVIQGTRLESGEIEFMK